MVVNLCLPHFSTTAYCNKVCADGYDVTNIVSADPSLRKRGFKLEYFLRPPLHVTLKFGFPVELCRVDVDLWPWGMDRGHTSKRLEISTCSDAGTLPSHGQIYQREQSKKQAKDQNLTNAQKQHAVLSQSRQSNGQRWERAATQTDSQSQSSSEFASSESEFKTVGRCELRDETQVSFNHLNFRPRAPFFTPPPPRPEGCRQENLWSRGPSSLGAISQLRVAVPFGGAASSLGLKALAVWGQPARCCPSEEVERIEKIHHKANERRVEHPVFAPPVRQTAQTLQNQQSVSIPEEFLDPLTQDVMMLPMLLPCGTSVDTSTLEEYQKREATWGRPPNDPFTGVPFSSTCQPLPNPQLKSRIDHFLLQNGMVRRDGALGGRDQGPNPRASRLVASSSQITDKNTDSSRASVQMAVAESPPSSSNRTDVSDLKPLCGDSQSELNRGKKRNPSDISADASTNEKQLQFQSKKKKNHSCSDPSGSSHEQLLSASLDKALFSALQGRPSFTSNLPHQGESTSQSTVCQSLGFGSSTAGGQVCSECSGSVSIYAKPASSVYRLKCGHLLCRACLQKESKPPNSTIMSNSVVCPTCQSLTPRTKILRVHQ